MAERLRVGQRKLWGIVSLAERYPRRLVNTACARALADGIYSYRHVKAATEKLVTEALSAIDRTDTTPVQGELAVTQQPQRSFADHFVMAVNCPDGHFKFPHLWPVKFPQAGR